jgi:hypothetical protein
MQFTQELLRQIQEEKAELWVEFWKRLEEGK